MNTKDSGNKFFLKSLIPTFSLLAIITIHLPKVGIKLIRFLLKSLVFTHARILFLVSLLFVALLGTFDPYSPFKFLIFIFLICLLAAMTYNQVHYQLQQSGKFAVLI